MLNARRPAFSSIGIILLVLLSGPLLAQNTLKDSNADKTQEKELKSGQYFINQTWSQETKFDRPYHVQVPDSKAAKQKDTPSKLPVFIFLHGNGGNAQKAIQNFTRHRRLIASRYVMVFPQGYRESWNIVSERSKANDLGFIEAIIKELATKTNVDPENFTIMGSSNGAALVNQLAIESSLPNIRNYITGVSQLNLWQHDGKNFKAKGKDNNYRVAATPARGKRLLNISGVKDRLVPYEGGLSKVIPAKQGKLGFVAAEKSTFLWAKQMGYTGEQLSRPTRTIKNIQLFSYLDGDVVHCRVADEGHGAIHGVAEEILLDFLKVDTNNKSAPPLRKVKYDDRHERNVLDFWPATDGGKPAPVFVWFHGGGFRNGDKSQLEKNRAAMLNAYLEEGYAVVSCNYPFLGDEMGYLDIAKHCARAIQFIRSKSKDWNLDSDRICCGGVSAGALISEFVAYHDDFADPDATDPVLRNSSRPAVVVSIMQPRGTKEFALKFMDKGEAPIFVYSNAKPSDRIHPPWAALSIRDKAEKLGIPCLAFGGGRNKLPQVPEGKKWLDLQIEFCEEHLSEIE